MMVRNIRAESTLPQFFLPPSVIICVVKGSLLYLLLGGGVDLGSFTFRKICFSPYALISLCTFCQFGTAVSLSILMTYSFVVRPDNGTQMGWALWTVWTSTAPLITIMGNLFCFQ